MLLDELYVYLQHVPQVLFLGIKLLQIFPWPSSFYFSLKVTKDIYAARKLNVGATFLVESIKSMP